MLCRAHCAASHLRPPVGPRNHHPAAVYSIVGRRVCLLGRARAGRQPVFRARAAPCLQCARPAFRVPCRLRTGKVSSSGSDASLVSAGGKHRYTNAQPSVAENLVCQHACMPRAHPPQSTHASTTSGCVQSADRPPLTSLQHGRGRRHLCVGALRVVVCSLGAGPFSRRTPATTWSPTTARSWSSTHSSSSRRPSWRLSRTTSARRRSGTARCSSSSACSPSQVRPGPAAHPSPAQTSSTFCGNSTRRRWSKWTSSKSSASRRGAVSAR